MATKIGSLIIQLAVEHGLLKSGLTEAQREVKKTTREIEQVGRGLVDFGQKMAVAVTLPVAAIAKSAVAGFIEQRKAMADVNAALASMGNASGKTAAELAKTADQLEMRSLFDAEVILKQVTAQLLTFGAIAGKEFDRAQQAAIDMAERLGAEPQAAAIMLGKALQAPAKGLTALGKTGAITQDWIAANKARIQGMLEEGRIAEAQGLILSAVEQQVRGAAAAAADATPWRAAQVAIGQAMDAIGEAVLPMVEKVANAVTRMAEEFNKLSPEMKQTIVLAGGVAAAIGPVLIVMGSLVQSTAGITAAFVTMSGGGVTAVGALRNVALAATGLGAIVIGLGLNLQQTTNLITSAAAGYAVYRGALLAAAAATRVFALATQTASSQMAVQAAAAISSVRVIGGLTAAKVALSGVTSALTVGVRSLTAALIANPFTAVAAAVGILAGAMMMLKENQRQARQETDNLVRSLKALAAARSADFALEKTKVQMARNAARDSATSAELRRDALLRGAFIDPRRYETGQLTKLERARLGGIAGALQNVNAEIGESRLQVIKLDADLQMADEAYQQAGKAAQQMAVPVAQTGAASEGAARQIRGLTEAAKPAADAMADLVEKLYPKEVSRAQKADLAYIDANAEKLRAFGKSVFDARMRVLGLRGDGIKEATVSKGILDTEPLVDFRAQFDRLQEELGAGANKARVQTVQIAESFRDMADKSIQALDRMVNAIRGGGFLDILGSVINFGLQLGSAGAFGKTIQANINAPRIPANANGTAFHPGGLMMVGERGPEILQVPRGGRVVPNHELRQAGEQAIRIILDERTDLVAARIDRRIGAASGAIAEGGAQIAQARLARRQTRRIG